MISNKLLDYLVWIIPIRSLRDKTRNFIWEMIRNNYKFRNFLYFMDAVGCNKNIKNNTFFITNHWLIEKTEFRENIFYQAIKNNYINDLEIYYRPDIELFSTFGSRNFLYKSKAKIKIFWTGECVSDNTINTMFNKYKDNCINDVDISLGFDRLDENEYKNYIRFPLWILYNFYYLLDKECSKDIIKETINNINNTKSKKNKFASLIARHDATKIREEIHDQIIKIDHIYCPSNLFHNDDTLKNDFNNNKIEYLRDFKFNICPENTISDGYITEKLFDSFKSGCIPIYNGDENIELDLVNKNALLFFRKGEDNTALIKEIEKLHKDDKLFDAFQKQIKINDSMVDYLWDRRIKILNLLEKLINEKLY